MTMERHARITPRDLELLAFIAEHRLVLAGHVQAHLGLSVRAAHGRLRSLHTSGYITQRRLFHHQPSCYQITRQGLAAIGSSYRAPRIDLACYAHDIGTAWLWLAARHGSLGPAREVISERRLRSEDARRDPACEPLGVRLGGPGPRGVLRLHYPDLLLLLPANRRVAVELELTGKGRGRREEILSGYGADPRIDAVLYLVENTAIGRAVSSSARILGIGQLVHVQRFQWGQTAPRPPAPVAARQQLRAQNPEIAR
jgi:hypothetical protein